jgi:transcriptional regulator with XRE-family HTH domain
VDFLLYLQQYCTKEQIPLTKLILRAGLSKGMRAGVHKGADPTPKTINKLARVMNVSAYELYIAAGYISRRELNSGSNVYITDMRIRDFFNSVSWDQILDEEKQMVYAVFTTIRKNSILRQNVTRPDKPKKAIFDI